MFSRVLVAMRPGLNHSAALRRVKELAQEQPLSVLLYSVVYDGTEHLPVYDTAAARCSIQESMRESQALRLGELAAHLEGLCEAVTTRCDWRDCTVSAINDAVQEFDAEAVLLTAGEHNRVSRVFRVNTDRQLIRNCRVPVLVCRDDNALPYECVMAAVTPMSHERLFSELDDRIIYRASSLASDNASALLVGHVYPSLDDAALVSYMPPVTGQVQWREEHRRALAGLLAQHSVPATAGRLTGGAPAAGITRLVKDHAVDLLVMGVLGESKLDGRSLGLIAEKVLDRVTCDVLFEPSC